MRRVPVPLAWSVGVLIVVALAVVGLPACGGGGSGGSAGGPEKTAWQKVLDGIRDDGTVPKRTALQAFSLALGPLPGVDVPDGEVGTITSATAAVGWLRRYFDELTPEQQQAAARLAPDLAEAPAPGGPGGPGMRLAGPPPGQDSPGAEKYRAEVDALVAEIGALIETGPLPYKVQIILEKEQDPAAMAAADFRNPCQLILFPNGQALTGPERHNVLAHEVFHCYEFFVLNIDHLGGKAPWLVEGMAEWAGATLAPSSALASEFWPEYLTSPTQTLFSRAYDAIGFYAHLEYAGGDVWSRLVPMLLAGDSGGNEGALDVAVDPGPLLDDWPSGYFRGELQGKHWDTDGPGITPDKVGRNTAEVTNGPKTEAFIPPASSGLLDLDLQADVVTFTELPQSGHVRLPDGSEPALAELSVPLCMVPGGCGCPEGSPLAGTDFAPMKKGIAQVALTGGLNAGNLRVDGDSSAKFCEPPKQAQPVPSGLDQCLVGTWVSTSFKPAVGGVAGGAEVTYQGGAGALFTVRKDRAARIDFDPMDLIEGQLTANGMPLGTSQIGFTGQVEGRISTAENRLFTLAPTSNTWAYSGLAKTDFGDFPFEGKVEPPNAAAPGTFDATYTCSPTTFDFTITGEGLSGGSTWQRQ